MDEENPESSSYVQLTFDCLTHVDAALICEFAHLLKKARDDGMPITGLDDDPTPKAKSGEEKSESSQPAQASSTSEPSSAKSKRKRRTKAEMEAARAEKPKPNGRETLGRGKKPDTQTASSETDGQDGSASTDATSEAGPTKSGRRSAPTEATAAGKSVRGRRKASASSSSSESATLADVIKTASSLAALTGDTQAVVDLFAEFGVGQAQDLPDEQRQEFIDRALSMMEKAA